MIAQFKTNYDFKNCLDSGAYGSSNRATIPSLAGQPIPQQFTLAFWARSTVAANFTDNGTVIMGTDGLYVMMGRHSNPVIGINFLAAYVNPATNTGIAYTSPGIFTAIQDQSWHHFAIAINRTAGTITLFVDGRLLVTRSGIDFSPIPSTFTFYSFGGITDVDSVNALNNWQFDDYLFYSSVWTESDAARACVARKPIKYPSFNGLLFGYDFNQNSVGAQIQDIKSAYPLVPRIGGAAFANWSLPTHADSAEAGSGIAAASGFTYPFRQALQIRGSLPDYPGDSTVIGLRSVSINLGSSGFQGGVFPNNTLPCPVEGGCVMWFTPSGSQFVWGSEAGNINNVANGFNMQVNGTIVSAIMTNNTGIFASYSFNIQRTIVGLNVAGKRSCVGVFWRNETATVKRVNLYFNGVLVATGTAAINTFPATFYGLCLSSFSGAWTSSQGVSATRDGNLAMAAILNLATSDLQQSRIASPEGPSLRMEPLCQNLWRFQGAVSAPNNTDAVVIDKKENQNLIVSRPTYTTY